jgi:hypothetical protein
VKVIGELDPSTAPELEKRLRHLRAEHSNVELDLSDVEFIYLSGARALAAVCPAEPLNPEPAPSAQAPRLFDLVAVGRLAGAA